MSEQPVRLSSQVQSHLSGTHAWQCPQDDDGYDGVAIRLMAKVQAAPKRKDGSCTVDLSDVERDALYDYTDAMVCGARDNIDPPGLAEPNWALAELNSGTALLRKLSNLKGK